MPNLKGTHEEVSEEAENKLQEKLNDMNFGDNLPESEPESEEPTSESKPEPEPTEEPEPEPEPTAEEPNEDGSKDKDSTPEADDKVEIPDGYIRAAKRQGWKDEDIAKTIEADPDFALRIFGNAYETSNTLTRDFAAAGRARAEQTAKELEEKNKVDEPEIKDLVNITELEKNVDDAAIVNGVVKPLNDALKSALKEIRTLKKTGPSNQDIAHARSDQDAATARANASANAASELFVKQFFGAENMKSYDDFYGVIDEGQNMNDITPNQYEHRMAVLQTADQLIAGKAAQGIKVSDADALEDAHLLVTEPLREKIITDGIRSSLKKRSKGKTLQPSKSRKTASDIGNRVAKTPEEAIENAEARLAKLKW